LIPARPNDTRPKDFNMLRLARNMLDQFPTRVNLLWVVSSEHQLGDYELQVLYSFPETS